MYSKCSGRTDSIRGHVQLFLPYQNDMDRDTSHMEYGHILSSRRADGRTLSWARLKALHFGGNSNVSRYEDGTIFWL